jgi:hypothetical protein
MSSILNIPDELALELDRLADAQKKPRTDYAIDVLWREVRRNRQRQALRISSGSWNLSEHPELTEGGAAYVERIRSERDDRFEGIIEQPR